jgi:hypothetical protein
MWQMDPNHMERMNADDVYGTESDLLDVNVEPWSTGHTFDENGREHFIRPWFAPENEGVPHNYKHNSIVFPPPYDTLPFTGPKIILNSSLSFGNVAQGDIAVQQLRIRNVGLQTLRVSIEPSQPPPQGQPLSGFRWHALNIRLAPGEGHTLIVEFTPRAEGTFTNRIKVSNNAGGSRFVTLRGRGLPHNIPPF